MSPPVRTNSGVSSKQRKLAIAMPIHPHNKSWQRCLIHPGNAASMRAAVKCGFAELRRVEYKGNETVVFVRKGRKKDGQFRFELVEAKINLLPSVSICRL